MFIFYIFHLFIIIFTVFPDRNVEWGRRELESRISWKYSKPHGKYVQPVSGKPQQLSTNSAGRDHAFKKKFFIDT